jgi:hypothetical protein
MVRNAPSRAFKPFTPKTHALPSQSNEIVTAEEKKAGKDLSAEFKEVLPNAKLLADGGNLADALEMLLELEKRARLASDSPTIKAIAVEMMSLCKSKAAWNDMVEVIGTLCKRRSQKSAVITKIVEEGMKLLDETPSREVKFQLIKILRTVTEGKIFAEHERAKLTMILALMLEEDGKVWSLQASYTLPIFSFQRSPRINLDVSSAVPQKPQASNFTPCPPLLFPLFPVSPSCNRHSHSPYLLSCPHYRSQKPQTRYKTRMLKRLDQ